MQATFGAPAELYITTYRNANARLSALVVASIETYPSGGLLHSVPCVRASDAATGAYTMYYGPHFTAYRLLAVCALDATRFVAGGSGGVMVCTFTGAGLGPWRSGLSAQRTERRASL